jgi:hypothetical protein
LGGAPNAQGYLRDDNSLIKSLPRSLAIRSPANSLYDGGRIGKGFVASHVWRISSTLSFDGFRGHTRVWLNSFVPNLVWLPVQVSKLSDREGSFVQLLLQALAYQLYRSLPVPAGAKDLIESLWEHLPKPKVDAFSGVASASDLAFFEATDSFFASRTANVRRVSDALATRQGGSWIAGKIITTRYTAGLNRLSWDMLEPLATRLSAYSDAISATS